MIKGIKTKDAIKLKFICPICKSEKSLQIPKSIITQTEDLTPISIDKGLVCIHRFQAYIDKDFIIRRYKRTYLEYETFNEEI